MIAQGMMIAHKHEWVSHPRDDWRAHALCCRICGCCCAHWSVNPKQIVAQPIVGLVPVWNGNPSSRPGDEL